MGDQITSPQQMLALLDTPKLVILYFYKDQNSVTERLAALGERLGNVIAFGKCNYGQNEWAEREYNITHDPTFIVFKSGSQIKRLSGIQELASAIPELMKEQTGGSSGAAAPSSSASGWLAQTPPGNYINITDQIEKSHLDIMNSNSDFGGIRTLLETTPPSALKHKNPSNKDWVESDTDEQLMIFIPFQTAVKLHSIQITSVPQSTEDAEDEDEIPSRPKTIKIFGNTSQILGFEEADEREPTQVVELKPEDWDSETHTATITTRFVKFQNCSAVTLFVVDVERDGAEKVRIDRLRIVGEKLYEKPDLMKMKQSEEE